MTMRNLIRILLYIWQLPQNLLGIAFKVLFYRPWKSGMLFHRRKNITVVYFYSDRMKGGITLGEYIFVRSEKIRGGNLSTVNPSTIEHEYGHVMQSRILGPLFLIVIGLPSLVHAGLHSTVCKNRNYYHFYTEQWADKLSYKPSEK